MIQNECEFTYKNGNMIIFLSPFREIPKEIEKLIIVDEFNYPDKYELEEILYNFVNKNEIQIDDDTKNTIVNYGLGLTKTEFISALSLSWVENEKLDTNVIKNQKYQLIKKNPVLEFYNPTDDDKFDKIGGLDNLKRFMLMTCTSELSKGVLLLGVPGTGKSSIAKALGNETGLPIIMLNFGKVFASKVGESEQRIHSALQLIDSFGQCILFIDEIEKGISGINSSHKTDGGTGSRVFGSFLQWMNDRDSKTYIIATCNDVTKIPPEFLRSERWDSMFFIDLPNNDEKKKIWEIYMEKFNIKNSEQLPNDIEWTGAEIRTCCRLAAMMKSTLIEASKFVIPIAQSMSEYISQLRDWAKDRCVPASQIKLENDKKINNINFV